jgi:hypothetical protein
VTTGGVLRCKDGVEFKVIAPGGFRILTALDGTARVMGIDLFLTAGANDHAGGRHPFGEAFDVSVHDMSPLVISKVKRHLEQILGDRFTVLYEVPERPNDSTLAPIAYVNAQATGPHFHIQVRKGTEYPPRNSGALFT